MNWNCQQREKSQSHIRWVNNRRRCNHSLNITSLHTDALCLFFLLFSWISHEVAFHNRAMFEWILISQLRGGRLATFACNWSPGCFCSRPRFVDERDARPQLVSINEVCPAQDSPWVSQQFHSIADTTEQSPALRLALNDEEPTPRSREYGCSEHTHWGYCVYDQHWNVSSASYRRAKVIGSKSSGLKFGTGKWQLFCSMQSFETTIDQCINPAMRMVISLPALSHTISHCLISLPARKQQQKEIPIFIFRRHCTSNSFFKYLWLLS